MKLTLGMTRSEFWKGPLNEADLGDDAKRVLEEAAQ